MENNNGKGIFYGVLGVMSLVIAILGASLAYFTASARSKEDAVTVQSATVAITYIQGKNILAEDLIPVTREDAEKIYFRDRASVGDTTEGNQNLCKDSNGRRVCSIFKFETENKGNTDLDITGKIITTTLKQQAAAEGAGDSSQQEVPVIQEFENLKYQVFDTTTGEPVSLMDTAATKDLPTFAKTGGTSKLFQNATKEKETISIPSGSKKSFEILIWLNEIATAGQLADPNDTEGNQDFEQGLKYTGTVEVAVSGTTDKITGKTE